MPQNRTAASTASLWTHPFPPGRRSCSLQSARNLRFSESWWPHIEHSAPSFVIIVHVLNWRVGDCFRKIHHHSAPICACFSATERFIISTNKIRKSVTTENIQKQSK